MGVSTRHDRTIPETIEVGGYRIHGVSVGSLETCVCIPTLSLAFDAGKCPPRAVSMRYMAITHGHCDHVHGLPLHLATRSLQKLPAPRYFLPPEIHDDVRNLVDSVAKLERSSFHFDSHAMDPLDPPIQLKPGWYLQSMKTVHTVPSQGYIVSKTKKKLKPEFANTPGKELARMRAMGYTLEDISTKPEIVFTGDTTLDAIANNKECREARILITEMTFLDESCSPADARRFGHIHIDEIIERQEIFKNNEFVVFSHFSARYTKEAIRKAFFKLPVDLREKSIAFGAGIE